MRGERLDGASLRLWASGSFQEQQSEKNDSGDSQPSNKSVREDYGAVEGNECEDEVPGDAYPARSHQKRIWAQPPPEQVAQPERHDYIVHPRAAAEADTDD